MGALGRTLVALGILLVAVGGLLWVAHALGLKLPFGRLPGDIHVQRGNWAFYVPLTTSILLSVLFTLILSFLSRR